MKRLLFCAGVSILLLAFGGWTQAEAAEPQFGQITENFDVQISSNTVIDDAGNGNESIARPTGGASTGFAWGAYNAGTGAVTFHSDPPPDIRGIMFVNGARANGSYCYTMFDTTTTLGGAERANVPSVALDMSSPAAGATLTAIAGRDTQVAIVIWDGRRWWRSGAKDLPGKNVVAEPMDTLVFAFAGTEAETWTAVAGPPDMSEVDNGGEAAITLGQTGTPDFENVQGMGVVVVTAAGSSPNLDILILDEMLLDGPAWQKPASARRWMLYR